MQKQKLFRLCIVRLKRLFNDRDVKRALVFNILFAYVWGYVYWGTNTVGTIGWWIEEIGHLLWSGFHTWIAISYQKRHNNTEFILWRWKEERIIWWRIVLFSVFGWEGTELLHDTSGLFSTIAQVGNLDTMADIFFSGIVAPVSIVLYRRWADHVSIFFTDSATQKTNEKDMLVAYKALCRIADQVSHDEPHVILSVRNLVKKEWQENHKVVSIVKSLFDVLRGSRRERKRRRAFVKNVKKIKGA